MSDKKTSVDVKLMSGFTLQVVLLVLWYTVAPELPAWLVFLPAICSGVLLVVAVICFAIYFATKPADRK